MLRAVQFGKTYRCDAETVVPYSAGANVNLRWTGGAYNLSYNNLMVGPVLDFRAPGRRVTALSGGLFEVDHLTVANGGGDCGTFFWSTWANMRIHDVSFVGGSRPSNESTKPCDDAWQAGGYFSTALSSSFNYPFQGYRSYFMHNYGAYMRRMLVGGTWFNAVAVFANFIDDTSGSDLPGAAAFEIGDTGATHYQDSTNNFMANGVEATGYVCGFRGPATWVATTILATRSGTCRMRRRNSCTAGTEAWPETAGAI